MLGNKFAKGHKHTDEWKKEQSKRSKGKPHKGGWKLSEETKRKMSNSRKNRIIVISDATREKLRKGRLGKKLSEDAKRKIGETHSRPIIYYNDKESIYFNSITELKRYAKTKTNIHRYIKNNRKFRGYYIKYK